MHEENVPDNLHCFLQLQPVNYICTLYCLNIFLTIQIALRLLDLCASRPLPGCEAKSQSARFTALLCLVSTALAVLESSSSLWFSSGMPALMSLQPRIFQRGQIVPEAAPGTVTTTGQVCQPTGPPPGNQESHTHTHTHILTHTHTH